jgi:hypothetical protein
MTALQPQLLLCCPLKQSHLPANQSLYSLLGKAS